MLAPHFLQWPLRPTVVHNTPRAVGGTEEVAVTICLQNTSTLQDRQTLQWLPLPTHFTTHPCPYISAITQSNTTQCNLRLPNLHLPLRRLPTSLGGIKSWLGAKEEARNAPFPTTHCTTTQGNSSLSRGVVSRGDNLASTTLPPGPRTDTWPKPTTTRSQTTWPQPQTGVSMPAVADPLTPTATSC